MKGNTILITGGASGIGLELAARLQQLGNIVIITGRDQAKLDRAVGTCPGLRAIRSDVSDPEAIASLHEEVSHLFPELNMLVNNAGLMAKLNLLDPELDMETLHREIATNLSGPIRMVKQFLPILKRQPQAAILNVSSALAYIPFPLSPVYGATKAGLHSYTQSLRVQLKHTRIQVFELAPPMTDTGLLGAFEGEDLKGGALMTVSRLIDQTIQGLERDQFEIRPGQSNLMRWMSRIAPGLMLSMLSKPVERMMNPPGAQ